MSEGNGTPKFIVSQSLAIPPKKRGNLVPRVATYPWDKMTVGASFFVPCARGKAFSAHNSRAKSHPGEKYEQRRVVENGTDGFRVWRTA